MVTTGYICFLFGIRQLAMKCLIDAALEISMRRRQVLTSMRKALEAGDDKAALDLAKQMCGLPHEAQTSNRANSSIN
jgi:hypothetical protein